MEPIYIGDLVPLIASYKKIIEKYDKGIKEVLYVYNDENPISDHKIRRKEQILAAKEIRKKGKYRKKDFI